MITLSKINVSRQRVLIGAAMRRMDSISARSPGAYKVTSCVQNGSSAIRRGHFDANVWHGRDALPRDPRQHLR